MTLPALVAALLAVGVVVAAVHRFRYSLAVPTRTSTGQRASFALLCLHLVVTGVTVDRRASPAELFEHGLSAQNRLQVVVVGMLAAWLLVLVTSGRLRWSSFTAGHRVWVSALIALYLGGAAWSLVPQLSAYRATELLVIWGLVLHAFGSRPRGGTVITYLVLAMVGIWIGALLHADSVSDLLEPGGVRANTGAPIAAAVLLMALLAPSAIRSAHRRWLVGTFAGASLVFYLSLTVVAALGGAAVLYVIARMHRSPARPGVVFLAGATAILLVLPPVSLVERSMAAGAGVLGHEQQHLDNWSGRIGLWEVLLDEVGEAPLGLGLGADRALVVRAPSSVPFRAFQAHNGYLAALVSGGWPALALVLCCFAAWFRVASTARADLRPVAVAVVILFAINNLTIPGIGGPVTTPWVLLMAMLAGGSEPLAARGDAASDRVAARPPGRLPPAFR